MPLIAALIPSLGLGGAERSLVRLMNVLADHGWSVVLVIFSAGTNELLAELRPDIKRHVVDIRRSSNPILWLVVYRMLRRINPDVVLAWSTYANLVACVTCWPWDKWRLIVSDRNYMPGLLHEKWTNCIRRWITLSAVKLLYRRADVITANSKANCRYLLGFIGGNAICRYLPNVTGLPFLNRHNMKPDDVPIDLKGPKLLLVGRFVFRKGLDIALTAMAQVRKTRPWSLVIVGEGEESESLQILSERLGLDEVVHWLGARVNPMPYYNWADIVLVPSRFEGFPNVALEAMASGCAVICSNCMTGPDELTAGGRFGMLVPTEDPDALAQAIIMMGDDPIQCRRLGEDAARHVSGTYHPDAAWPLIEKVFISDLEKRRGTFENITQ